MSRTAILLSASFILAIAGCGDDTGGEGGSTSSSTSASGSTSSTPSTPASSGSSSDGGSTNEGGSTSDGGAPGDGGAGGAGDGGTSGVGGNASFEEACEDLNDMYDQIADDMKCFVELGVCEEPEDCAEENRAYIDCLRAELDEEDCFCQAADDSLRCPDLCTPEEDAYFACLDAL